MASHNQSNRRLQVVTDDYVPMIPNEKALYDNALAGRYGGNTQTARHNTHLSRGMKRFLVAAGSVVVAAAGIFAYNQVTDESETTVVIGSHVVTADDAAGKLKVAQTIIDGSNGGIKVSAEELVPYMHTRQNSEAGTVQDPADNILQLGEQVDVRVPEAKVATMVGPPTNQP